MKPTLKFILLILVIVAIGWAVFGCARIQAGEFSYTRIGNQNIEGTVTTPDGLKIELKQSSKAESMKILLEAIKKMQ